MSAGTDATIPVRIWRGTSDGRFERYDVPKRRVANGARRRHARPAPCRRLARLSLRLPRRHVRLVRDDGQRQGALDVPHARRRGRRRRDAGDRAARAFADHPRPGRRHDAVLRQVGGGAGVRSCRRRHATTRSRRWSRHRRARREVDATIECIGCAVCYAACDVVGWKPDYLGPAALNRAWTLVNDVRDGAGVARLRAVAGDAGCHACHTHQSCTERCPKHLAPTASIAGLKRLVAIAAVKGRL